jgi:hypothetical protein
MKKPKKTTEIHIGKLIKEKFEESRMSKSAFAVAVNMHRNNVYDLFTRQSVDTALLERVGEVLNYNFFSLFVEKTNMVTVEEASSAMKKKIVFVPVELNDTEFETISKKII